MIFVIAAGILEEDGLVLLGGLLLAFAAGIAGVAVYFAWTHGLDAVEEHAKPMIKELACHKTQIATQTDVDCGTLGVVMRSLTWSFIAFITLSCSPGDKAVAVYNTPPIVTLEAPVEGEEFQVGEAVTFVVVCWTMSRMPMS